MAPTSAPAADRHKLSKNERKARARERAAAYRERQRVATEDPAAQIRAAAEQAARDTADKLAAEATEKARAAEVAVLEKRLTDAIAGSLEILCDGAQQAFADAKGPRYGTDRSRDVGRMWAEILAPRMDPRLANALAVVVASTGTAGSVFAWRAEYVRWRSEQQKTVPLRAVPDAAPQKAAGGAP